MMNSDSSPRFVSWLDSAERRVEQAIEARACVRTEPRSRFAQGLLALVALMDAAALVDAQRSLGIVRIAHWVAGGAQDHSEGRQDGAQS